MVKFILAISIIFIVTIITIFVEAYLKRTFNVTPKKDFLSIRKNKYVKFFLVIYFIGLLLSTIQVKVNNTFMSLNPFNIHLWTSLILGLYLFTEGLKVKKTNKSSNEYLYYFLLAIWSFIAIFIFYLSYNI